jgi:hypothetical protein
MEDLNVTLCGKVFKNNKEVKQYKDKYGYMYLSNKNKKYKVHRLVLFNYIGKSDKQVHHKNNIKTDNRISNLEYVTHNLNDFKKWTDHRKANLKYIGVCKYKNKYRCQIQINGIKKHLGYFKNPKIANAYYLSIKENLLNYGTI